MFTHNAGNALSEHDGCCCGPVAGYAAAMETVFAHCDAIDLTENHIRQLHGDLLQYADKDAPHRGEYKTIDNQVEAFGHDGESVGVVFETTSPSETPVQMEVPAFWQLKHD